MSPRFHTVAQALSRRNSHRASLAASIDFVPFSYTLFFLAVFHLSVWSLGVACDPAQGYFAAHTCSLKLCDASGQPTPFQDLLTAQKQQEEQARTDQQALRLIREREASHAHGSHAPLNTKASETQVEGGASHSARALLSLVFLLTTFTGTGQSKSEAAAAATTTYHKDLTHAVPISV